MGAAVSHPCAIPNCGTMLGPAGHLMCRKDWRRVPPEIQDEVNRTWAVYREYDLRNGGTMEGFREARTAYYAAREAAIAAVVGPQPDLPLSP